MYDYVVRNGLIVDGKRTPPFSASLCIQSGKIAAITTDPVSGRQELDAAGWIVSPGFLDIHTHSDPYRLLSPLAESKLYQGVTFELAGNCGISLVPTPQDAQAHAASQGSLAQMLAMSSQDWNCTARDVAGLAHRIRSNTIHIGTLIGHGTLRSCVMGFDMRAPTSREMEEMKKLLDQMLEQGAFGLSLGLIYPPGSFCEFEELEKLAQVVAARDRMLSIHMRNENAHIFEAVEEAIRLAEATGVRVQISHLKLMGVSQWGRGEELLDRLRAARAWGLDIHADQYPYDASSTALSALLPHRAHDGGVAKMLERLGDEAQASSILAEAEQEMNRRGGAGRVRVSSTGGIHPQLEGHTLEEISQSWQCSSMEAAAKLLLDCGGGVDCIYHSISRADVLAIMKEPFVAVGSDGRSYPLDRAKVPENPHRRSFGTFPMFLQTVREEKLMPLEDAVYKMTGLSAGLIGLHDRGVLEPGKAADLTIFDWDRVEDCSTYANSAIRPKGIEAVFVEGEPVLLEGEITSARKGRFILHPSARQAD